MSRWGKDHWSMLGYVTTCFDGEVKRDVLRCNTKTHPLLRGRHTRWEPIYGTRLRDKQLPQHDDWDCLDDLEAAGLVEIISLVNGFIRLTKAGSDMAYALREHKRRGGGFASFEPPTEPCPACNGQGLIPASAYTKICKPCAGTVTRETGLQNLEAGAWSLLTHFGLSSSVAQCSGTGRPDDAPHPSDGNGMWWRTHHLVRQLGGQA